VDLGELVRAGSAISLLSVGANCHCGAERGRFVYDWSEGRGGGKWTKLAKGPFKEAMPIVCRSVSGGDVMGGWLELRVPGADESSDLQNWGLGVEAS